MELCETRARIKLRFMITDAVHEMEIRCEILRGLELLNMWRVLKNI